MFSFGCRAMIVRCNDEQKDFCGLQKVKMQSERLFLVPLLLKQRGRFAHRAGNNCIYWLIKKKGRLKQPAFLKLSYYLNAFYRHY